MSINEGHDDYLDDDEEIHTWDDVNEKVQEMEANIEDIESSINELWNSVIARAIFYFGAMLSMVISFSINHSVLWGIIHGIFSWGYVVYYLIIK